MSFSSDVKAELAKNISGARHCRLAELAGLMHMTSAMVYKDGKLAGLCITTERSVIARTISRLIKMLFGLRLDCKVSRTGKNSRVYRIMTNDLDAVTKIATALKFDVPKRHEKHHLSCQEFPVNRLVTQHGCCKREFIKGMFMASGSVSDPNKGYHFELVCNNPETASFAKDLLGELGIGAKTVVRKKYHLCYIKDGTVIVDMLNIMGAHISLMNMENVRIEKDVRNNINRHVNCETANLNKTINAAVKQIEDIEFIINFKGIGFLPENLRELALIRVEEPDASLKELGEMMTPPLGKSGVNHRLKKISDIANDLRACR